MSSSCRISVFIATSLDGFIARKDGEIDWLEKANATVPAGEDCGYGVFFDSVDALVMGRKTFEKVLSFDQWPYGEKRVLVLSNQIKELPSHLPKSVSVTSAQPREIVTKLSQEGAKHLYLDGGSTIQSFLAANLVDELIITTIPVLLGEGIYLFGPIAKDISLKHIKTQVYPNGFVQTHYHVNKA